MFDRAAELCAAAVAGGTVPSVSMAVAVRGEVVLAGAWGLADPATARPATVQTAYLLASVTKPLTATAVCALAARGAFRLDEPITAHLPWFGPARPGLGTPTIRQLLAHTAGLGLYLEFRYPGDGTTPGIADVVARHGRPFHPPGQRFGYTNLGYGILDALLAESTGATADAVLAAEVFEPLRLGSACVGPEYTGPAPHSVPQTVTGVPYPPYDTPHRGASLGWASASDVAMFGQGLLGWPGALAPDIVTAMSDPPLAGAGYGLGLTVGNVAGQRILGHDGTMGGVGTALRVLPDLDASLAVLTNRMGSTAQDVARCLVSDLVPGAPDRAEAAEPPVTVTDGLAGTRWRGRIDLPGGPVSLDVHIAPDRHVTARVAGGPWRPAGVEASYHIDPACDLLIRLPDPLPTAAARRSPRTFLALERVGGRLAGAARTEPWPDDAAGWFGNCFSFWCVLDPDVQ